MATQTNLNQKTMFSYIECTSVDGFEWVPVSTLTITTSDTASNFATGNYSASADALVGYKIKVISSSENAIVGESADVINNGAIGTITVSPSFSATVPVSTIMKIYSVTGDPVWVCSANGTTTQIIDSSRSDTAGQFNGAYLASIYGSDGISAGVVRQISASYNGSCAVSEAFAASAMTSYMFKARRLGYVENLKISYDKDFVARQVQRNNFSTLSKLVGGGKAVATFDIEATPLASRAGDGTAAARAWYGRLLQRALGGEALETGDVWSSGGATTSWTLTDNDTHYSGSQLGACICVHNQMRWVTAHTASSAIYTVNKALSAEQAANSTVYGTANYYLDNSSSSEKGHIVAECNYDNLHWILYNGRCNGATFSMKQGSRPMWSFSFIFDTWISDEVDTVFSASHFQNIQPQIMYGGEMFVDGTAVPCTELTVDMGFEVNPVESFTGEFGKKGFSETSRAPKATLNLQMKNNDQVVLMQNARQVDVMAYVCNEGEGVGCHFKGNVVSIEGPNNNNGILYHTVQMDINEFGTTGVPDFVFSQS